MENQIDRLTASEINIIESVCEDVFQNMEDTDLEDRLSLSDGFDMAIENMTGFRDKELDELHDGLSKVVRRLCDWQKPADSVPYAILLTLVVNANWMVRQATGDVVFKDGEYFIPDTVRQG